MKLESVPFDLHLILFTQLVDPTLADIAERSDKIAEDSYRFHAHIPHPRLLPAFEFLIRYSSAVWQTCPVNMRRSVKPIRLFMSCRRFKAL